MGIIEIMPICFPVSWTQISYAMCKKNFKLSLEFNKYFPEVFISVLQLFNNT
jgi:hypothetical protein